MAEIYTTGTWRVSPAKQEAFIAAWAEFGAWASGRPGGGTLTLMRDVKDDERFVSVGEWATTGDAEAWKATSEFSEGLAKVLENVDDFKSTELTVLVTAKAGSSDIAAPAAIA